MPPASGLGHSISSSSLGKLFRRSEQSQDDGSGSEASSQVDPPVGLGFDSTSLAGGPSTPLLSGEDIEREKYRIVDILNPNVRNPEDVSERLDKVNDIFENWESSEYPQLAATARYRNNSAITAQALLDGATAFLSVRGRANAQSERGWNQTSKIAAAALKVGTAVPIPGASALANGISMALSAYTKKYRFDDINKALTKAIKEKERVPFRESFSLALALIKMGTLGDEEHTLSQPRDNKGKKTLKKDPERRIKEIREEEEESAGKDTSNALLALVFGKVFQNWEKVKYDKILDKLWKTPTEKKVELALDRLCKKQKIDFDERMVACRPPRNAEMRELRKRTSAVIFNQNPWEEAIPAPAPGGGYGPEEPQSITDIKAAAEAASQRILRKIEQKDGAKTIHEDLLQKADDISRVHFIDKKKANDAADIAGERYRRKKKELKQAEADYERLLDEAYGKSSHHAVTTQVYSDKNSRALVYDNGTPEYLDQLTFEKIASLGRLYFATGKGKGKVQWVDELTAKERTSLGIPQASSGGDQPTYPEPVASANQQVHSEPRADEDHEDLYSDPGPSSSRPSGNNQTGLNIQYATHGLIGTLPHRPSASGSTHVQAGPFNQAGIPAKMNTGRPLGESPWQAAPALAPRENLVYEPESDEESRPGPSTRQRNRKNEAAQPSGSGSTPAAPSTRPDDDDIYDVSYCNKLRRSRSNMKLVEEMRECLTNVRRAELSEQGIEFQRGLAKLRKIRLEIKDRLRKQGEELSYSSGEERNLQEVTISKQHKREYDRGKMAELTEDEVKLQKELAEGRQYWRKMGLTEEEGKIKRQIAGIRKQRWEIKRSLRKQGEDLDWSGSEEINAIPSDWFEWEKSDSVEEID